MGPASRRATRMPRSVRTLTAVPPPAPDPMTTTSYVWGLRVICNILWGTLIEYIIRRMGRRADIMMVVTHRGVIPATAGQPQGGRNGFDGIESWWGGVPGSE